MEQTRPVSRATRWRTDPPEKGGARPEQLPPTGDWHTWLVLAGRAWGKTRTAVEWVNERAASNPRARIALVARTAADARDTMVEGESGILEKSPRGFRPIYEPSKRKLTWPNGARAWTYSGDKPEQLRGGQFTDAWGDELAHWRYPEAWDVLAFAMRLSKDPRLVATTTPLATALIRELVADATVHKTRGRTKDNAANLPKRFLDKILAKYEGTRLGRQELDGEVLDDAPGALWKRAWIEANRRRIVDKEGNAIGLPDYVRIVVAIDPAVSTDATSAETGIIVCALGDDGRGYVLDDLSGRFSPAEWATVALDALERWKADAIVVETNQGGDMVEHTVRTVAPGSGLVANFGDDVEPDNRNVRTTLGGAHVSIQRVHASRGKVTRAEPIAALDEQGKISHVGSFPKLEDQLCGWDPLVSPKSPDRLDARVWGFTALMLSGTFEAELSITKYRAHLPRSRFS